MADNSDISDGLTEMIRGARASSQANGVLSHKAMSASNSISCGVSERLFLEFPPKFPVEWIFEIGNSVNQDFSKILSSPPH